MTKLIFTYSWIYDKSIHSWLKEEWKEKYVKGSLEYARELQKRWNRINDKVFLSFESFGFKFPTIWQAYPVTSQKIVSFSDPLTFKISYNWDHVFTTLIHELAHCELSYPENKKLKDRTFKYIKKTFLKETPQTRAHVPVNLLQLGVMREVFPKKYKKMFSFQKSLPRLKRAREIIEKNKKRINLSEPIESILNLKP